MAELLLEGDLMAGRKEGGYLQALDETKEKNAEDTPVTPLCGSETHRKHGALFLLTHPGEDTKISRDTHTPTPRNRTTQDRHPSASTKNRSLEPKW